LEELVHLGKPLGGCIIPSQTIAFNGREAEKQAATKALV
jgi:hypothetical protein